MAMQTKLFECDGELFTHQFLCHYRPWRTGFDLLSKSLIRFKNGDPPDVWAWTECAMEELSGTLQDVTIIRALHHHELSVPSVSDFPLDRLGVALAEPPRVYVPQLLSKTRISAPQKSLNLQQRQNEMSGLYQFTFGQSISSLLLIDDIVTTGQTISSIIRAIRSASRNVPIHLFTLACTDRDHPNTYIQLKGQAYEWQLREGWTSVKEDVGQYSFSMSTVKSLIHRNFDSEESG